MTVDNTNDRGDWIETYTGGRFYPKDPQAADINILDIAHALSLTCRFGGHCSRFYSIAEHSVYCAFKLLEIDPLRWNKRFFLLSALLHDASEAYLLDIPRPIKKMMPEYKKWEKHLQSVINTKFKLDKEHCIYPEYYSQFLENIKFVDELMLFSEAKSFNMNRNDDWVFNVKTTDKIHIIPLMPEDAERLFLNVYDAILTDSGVEKLYSQLKYYSCRDLK